MVYRPFLSSRSALLLLLLPLVLFLSPVSAHPIPVAAPVADPQGPLSFITIGARLGALGARLASTATRVTTQITKHLTKDEIKKLLEKNGKKAPDNVITGTDQNSRLRAMAEKQRSDNENIYGQVNKGP